MDISVIGTRGFPYVEGGVEKHCEALYPRMIPDVEVTVYRRKPYVKTQGSYEGVSFIDLPSTRIKGFETVLHSFLATCSALRRKPDIVHYHNIGPALFSPLLKLRSIPMVLTFHSANYEHEKWNGFEKRLLRYCEKVALKNAKEIIFVNRFQMQLYPEDVKAKATYIPNGIMPPVIPSGCEFLDQYGLKRGQYILSVGRITPEKGFDTLIEAFNRADENNYKLVIVGGVESEKGYKTRLDRLVKGTSVVFTGQLQGEALAQVYCNAALYILASRNEGFPLALLESMSYGLNVLVSDIPATHLVPLDPSDYCPVDDVEAFAMGIQSKLSNPCKRDYDLNPFDWNSIAQRTIAIYKCALT